MKEVLYMVIDVDDDKELPLFVGSIEEVARWAKTTPNCIRSAISHSKKRKNKSKYVRVEV